MGNEIFSVDYSNCDSTNREIQSNINYLGEIKDLIVEVGSAISSAGVPSRLWNSEEFYSNKDTLNRYVSDEINRYTKFRDEFKNFYIPIEGIDLGLENLIKNQLKFIDDNKDYNTYVSILQMNQGDMLEGNLFDILINNGLSEDEATKISLLYNMETRNLIDELLVLNESELQKKIDEMKNKAIKSPEEILLIDIFSLDKNSSRVSIVNDLNGIISSGTVSTWLNSKYVGKDISQFNLDIKSLDGEINKLTQQIRGSQLSKTKVNIMKDNLARLKDLRNTKFSKATKLQSITGTIGKVASVAAIAYQVYEISSEQYEEYFKNGAELDDTVVAIGIDVVGIVAAGAVGAKIASGVGTLVGGPIGTVAGVVVGFIGGVLVGAVYGIFIDPLLTDIYNDIVEPTVDWIADRFNDLGDWWDTIWW